MYGLEKTVVKDMTAGTPWKLILGFSLPLMIGNILQQVYTFVDTLIVGQVLGINALAAVGVTEWMIFLMFASIQGIVQGFSIIMAQCFGAGDDNRFRKAVYNGLCLVLVIMTGFTVTGQVIVSPALRFLNTPDEIIGMSAGYLRILYMGIPLIFIYNYLTAILRSVGNSKIPLQAITISSIANIILDILFVYQFGWGIKGAAIATLLAIFMSVMYCFLQLRKFSVLHFPEEDRKIDLKTMSSELKLGMIMGLQNVITSVGGLVVQSVINGFGVIFIAGYTAASKLYGLLEIAAGSYGYAMNTYVGQNKGAKKSDRLRTGLLSGNILGAITACGMSAIMILFGKHLLRFFIVGSADVVALALQSGYRFLRLLSVFFPCLYMLYIVRAWIQGTGNSFWPMVSSVAQLIMRVSCALVLSRFIGADAVYWGEVSAWIGADIFLYLVYLKKFRSKTVNVKLVDIEGEQ